ncbi:heavy metal translocating P-type ATPase [Falsirhodobacter deserti]|uniref:heavy metal translocating P-type ATPase n=1 Tax=Falsirhodobacter deserti TaxID=1365611 RepID=UPI000FE3E469|nr:heavy metal translocating P-type ATPase [Falsirhodobacter deserti]
MSTASPTVFSLPITGLSCASCVGRAERALAAVPGVSAASVNLATERAEVRLAAPVPTATLVRAVTDAGYGVPTTTTELLVEGMSCASCVGRVERALADTAGVTEVAVNLATERATVTGVAPAAQLVQAIAAAGYPARPATTEAGDETAARRDAEQSHLKRDLIMAAALAVPVFVLEMGSHVIPGMHDLVMATLGDASWYLQFVLTTLVLALPGRRFYRKGIPALMRLAPDMNSLVAVGTLAAFAYSVMATFAPALLPAGTVHVYYEAAAVIVVLVLLGRWLEARAKGRTSDAIRRLVGLQAKTARVRRGGTLSDLPINEVVEGDIIDLRPGERVPVDGLVTAGESYVDESMITGEPVPVAKSARSPVVAGTVNGNGALTFRATGVGEATMLAQIIRMVQQAQGSKLPMQALVDRVTMWFVPAVMAAAAVTFLVWLVLGPQPALGLALVNAVAVLIVACPCAMGLATPTSIMVGTGRGAELGILFRKGEALQRLRDARVVALDKTGTLTGGRPALTDLEPAPGFDRVRVLTLVAAAEAGSEHPVARAVVRAAEAEGRLLPQAHGMQAVTGFGIRATVDGHAVAVGAARFMRDLGLDVSALDDAAARMGTDGKTPFYAAIDGRLAAIMAVADPIRATTPQVIEALHRQGLTVAMITGDATRTAEAIARRLGIDTVMAEVLPAGKADAIRQLRAQHGPVAFVGDGINDAPALAEADVGIAVGSGTDVAIESADVVLLSRGLAALGSAIGLSRATIGNIRQNLFWAFIYNVALIPVAAGLLYPAWGVLLSPVLAAGAMALSSVFVLGNALRLKRFGGGMA